MADKWQNKDKVKKDDNSRDKKGAAKSGRVADNTGIGTLPLADIYHRSITKFRY